MNDIENNETEVEGENFYDEDFETTNEKIKNYFNTCEIITVDKVKMLVNDILIRLDTDKLPTDNIFEDGFWSSNTMITCEIVKTKGRRQYFNLSKLHNADDLMFYKKSIPGNMQIAFNDRTPSATFSSIGNMTLIGGKSVAEVAYCLARACHKVIHYEKQVDEGSEMKIVNLKIVNRVCVCSLGRTVDLLQVQTLANKLGFESQFKQHKFPSVYLTPTGMFSFNNESLTVSIGPGGGVNILGFKSKLEVALLSILLSKIIEPCLRDTKPKKVFGIKQFKEKLKKKREKNQEWVERTKRYKKIKNVPDETDENFVDSLKL